jgi:hypothetical protein
VGKKQCEDRRQLDLFRVAAVIQFPLYRRAALVRGIAETMAKKPTQKQRLAYLSREVNFQYASLLSFGLPFREVHDEVIRFRDQVISEYHRLIYASNFYQDDEGDDAA